MHRITRLTSAFCAVALSLVTGCAAMKLPAPSLPGMGDPSAPVGSSDWWRAHKKKAVFEGPGKGWSVAGYPGYFDDEGRPINMRVAKVVDKKDGGGGLLGDADFQKRVTGIKEQVGLGPNQTQAQADYAAAEQLFQREKYGEAAKLYKKAASRWPDSQLEQDAMFYQAESQFFAADYSAANNSYEKLIRKYPNSTYLDNVITRQFSIARYWEQYHGYNENWATTPNFFDDTRPLFDTIGRSMKAYENIRINDPTGPLADDAVMATANSYFLRGRYNDADYQYDLLRKDYPRSDHQYDAHILGLQCKLRKYQGPSYDGKPLEEAKLLVKQLKIQFSGELDQKQRAELSKIDGQISQELATREFNMAKHFDGIEEYGSAKYYYAQVIEEYPESQLAVQARERMQAIGGLPERPSSMLDPALDLLPESDERQAIADVPLKKSPGTQVPQLDEGQARMASAADDASEPAEPVRR